MPWVYAIARFKLTDAFRRRGRRIEIEISEIEHTVAAPETELALGHEIGRALSTLSAGQKAVVCAISVEGKTIGETAKQLGMTESAVGLLCIGGLRRLTGGLDDTDMDTNKLIRALSADAGRRSRLTSVSWLGVAAATVMAATIFLMLIGPRADIAEAAKSVRFLFKFVVTLTLVATAIFLVVRMSRPGASLTAPLSLLGLVPVLLVGAIGLEFLTVPADQWSQRWIGSNSMVCLTFIPLIGVAPLAVFLAAMRYGAPTRLGLAGAVPVYWLAASPQPFMQRTASTNCPSFWRHGIQLPSRYSS